MAEDVQAPPTHGNLLDHYYVLQDLAPRDEQRTASRSFLALQQTDQREVALVLPEGGAEGREELLSSQLERCVALQSPSLPRLLAGGRIGPRYYFASEFVGGVDLATLLKGPRLPTEVALYLLRVLTEAISTLHSNGFSHGDLHPGNVVLEPNGTMRLVGFVPAPFGLPLTTRSADRGVRRYASPEFLQDGRIHPVGDVYSMGLLCYELFTGRPLLPRGSTERTLKNQVEIQKALERVARVTRSVPLELSNVLRSMIQVDPSKRPRFGLELLGALDGLLPEDAALEPIRGQLSELLPAALRNAAKGLVTAAHQSLSAGEPLPAAASLHRATRLGLALEPGEKAVLGQLLRRAMWRAFPAAHSGLDPATERTYQRAMFLQLLRGSRMLGDAALTTLAGYRLAKLVDGPSQLPDDLPSDEELGYLLATKPRLIGGLRADSLDDDGLLTLAVLIEDFRPHADAPRSALKQELLRCTVSHSSPDAAIGMPAGAAIPMPPPPPPRPEPLKPASVPGTPEAVSIPPAPPQDDSDVDSALEFDDTQDADTLSGIAPASWIESENPNALVDIILDAVFESHIELDESGEEDAAPHGNSPLRGA